MNEKQTTTKHKIKKKINIICSKQRTRYFSIKNLICAIWAISAGDDSISNTRLPFSMCYEEIFQFQPPNYVPPMAIVYIYRVCKIIA